MNHHFGKPLRVSLLVVAVSIGVFTPRRSSAEDAGTLQAQADVMIDQNLSAATPKTNLLVLRGDPSSIMEALPLIELLDAPPQAANAGKPQDRESEAAVPVRPADADPSFEWVYEREIYHPADSPNTADELQRFQGIWPMDICDSENMTLYAPQEVVKTWIWSIQGNQIAWSRSNDEVWHLTFSIDPSKSPRQIDLTYLDGPFKDVTCQGVYQWGGVKNDMLMLSLQDPGAEVERPKTITMTSGEQTSLIFLNPRETVMQQDDHQRHKQELDSLQGTWSLEIIQTMSWPKPMGKGPDKSGQGSERQWVINGNEITWTSPTGEEVRLSFIIDTTQSPKYFDVKFLSGPFRGKESQGIYKRGGVSGKMLWLCLTDPLLNTARPTKFGMDSISRHTLIGFSPDTPKPNAPAADKRITAVEGRLLELNQPGSITAVISLGADDGVKFGDILTISRKGTPIGRLKVRKVERDRSTATIVAVDDTKALEVGDQITLQLPEVPQDPIRQSPQDNDTGL